MEIVKMKAPEKDTAEDRNRMIKEVCSLEPGGQGIEISPKNYDSWKTYFYSHIKDTGMKFTFRKHPNKSKTWNVWRII